MQYTSTHHNGYSIHFTIRFTCRFSFLLIPEYFVDVSLSSMWVQIEMILRHHIANVDEINWNTATVHVVL